MPLIFNLWYSGVWSNFNGTPNLNAWNQMTPRLKFSFFCIATASHFTIGDSSFCIEHNDDAIMYTILCRQVITILFVYTFGNIINDASCDVIDLSIVNSSND